MSRVILRGRILAAAASAAVVFGLLLTAGPAAAKDVEIRRSVKAGEAAELLPHSSMRGECESKLPKIKILDVPRNGTTAIKEGERKFERGTGNFAKCDGKTGVGARVVYTPKSGFEGADRFRYEVTFESGSVTTYAVSLRIGKQDPAGWSKPK